MQSRQYYFKDVDELSKLIVWQKGEIIPGWDQWAWRKDMCGALMSYAAHGDRNSPYGWEIDHIFPKALGGTDDINNLQPLWWHHNARKGDRFPWACEL